MSLFLNASVARGFPVLDELSWRQGPTAALHAVRRLLAMDTLSDDVLAWITRLPPAQLERVIEKSLERSTHFKWFLGETPRRYTVWLHEYKSPESFSQTSSFAASVHDHRYGFCSRVLSGALNVSAFGPAAQPGSGLELISQKRVGVGATMLLNHEDIHRVDCVDPHTYTMVVQGPAARSYSTCYNLADGQEQRMYDLQSRLPGTLEAISNHLRESLSVS